MCCGATNPVGSFDGKTSRQGWFLAFVFAVVAIPAVAADQPRPPADLYKTYCSTCHEGAVPRAPHSINFPMIGPTAILGALESGVMRAQGSALTAAERRSLAEFLGGASLAASNKVALKRCDAAHAQFDFKRPPPLAGWSMTLEGTRFVDAQHAGLTAQDIPGSNSSGLLRTPARRERVRNRPSVPVRCSSAARTAPCTHWISIRGACAGRSSPTPKFVRARHCSRGRAAMPRRGLACISATSMAMPTRWTRRRARCSGRHASRHTRESPSPARHVSSTVVSTCRCRPTSGRRRPIRPMNAARFVAV